MLAVVGENGAGKSTLMKILAGLYQPDDGEILLDGRPVRFASVTDAMAAGISLIHQELNLAENLSVAANVFLGRERLAGRLWLDDREMAAEAGRLPAPGRAAGIAGQHPGRAAGPGQKQLVEIARALSLKARVIIMDEPTSSLTQRRPTGSTRSSTTCAAGGVAIIYISHRLAEVKRVADRVTVLRDGKNAGELAKARDQPRRHRPAHGRPRPEALLPADRPAAARGPAGPRGPRCDLRRRPARRRSRSRFAPARSSAWPAWSAPAGPSWPRRCSGSGRSTAGEVLLDGKPVRSATRPTPSPPVCCWSPRTAGSHGLVLAKASAFNLSLPNLDLLSAGGLVSARRERTVEPRVCATACG